VDALPGQPVFELGPLDVFASPAELRPHIGPISGEQNDRRAAIAMMLGTRHWLHLLGYAFTDAEVPADPAVIEVVPVSVRASWRAGAIAAAVRFYKSGDVPFGVAGGWDMATYVRMSIPDVDMMALGERVYFGIA
jgi:hypothetical protein